MDYCTCICPRGLKNDIRYPFPERYFPLGSGEHPLPADWINADIVPQSGGIYLDATKRFPFRDGEVDRIFSEHMIEHIPYAAGLFMLGECHRILRPGGRIRVATPDLQVLLALNTAEPAPMQQRYLRWITERFLPGRPCRPSFVINNAFRNWGHQFLYDAEILAEAQKP